MHLLRLQSTIKIYRKRSTIGEIYRRSINQRGTKHGVEPILVGALEVQGAPALDLVVAKTVAHPSDAETAIMLNRLGREERRGENNRAG